MDSTRTKRLLVVALARVLHRFALRANRALPTRSKVGTRRKRTPPMPSANRAKLANAWSTERFSEAATIQAIATMVVATAAWVAHTDALTTRSARDLADARRGLTLLVVVDEASNSIVY